MEDQAEDLQRDDAEQRLVTWLAENDWRVTFALSEPHIALGNVPLDLRPVGQDEGQPASRRQAECAPVIGWQQAVLRATVHQEPDHAGRARGPAHNTLDEGQPHVDASVSLIVRAPDDGAMCSVRYGQ